MYKIFIVDDEEYVIKSLIKSLQKIQSGFEVVNTSCNSLNAHKIILETMPDVVFTDIRMPGMNGLELIKNVKEELPDTIFIVISGYAEFVYAQKAMNYGAIGYCLKPFDDSEIAELLKKAKNMLDASSPNTDEPDLISLIEEPNNKNYSLINRYFSSMGIDTGKGMVISASIGYKQLTFGNKIRYVHMKTGNAKHIYFFQYTGEAEIKRLFPSKLPDGIKGIGISAPLYKVEHIKNNIDEATMLAFQYFITGKQDLYFRTSSHNKEIDVLIKSLEKNISNPDIFEVNNALSNIKAFTGSRQLDVKQAMKIYNSFISLSNNLDCQCFGEYIYSIEELCSSFKDVNAMITQLETVLLDISGKKHGELKEDIKNKYFIKILDYVNLNFYTEISIQSLGKTFSINPSYISQLFRKEVSMTFTDYITKLRVDYACDLLRKTKYTIEDIANKCGYSDYFYFIRVFKKATGQTPGQFRKSASQLQSTENRN